MTATQTPHPAASQATAAGGAITLPQVGGPPDEWAPRIRWARPQIAGRLPHQRAGGGKPGGARGARPGGTAPGAAEPEHLQLFDEFAQFRGIKGRFAFKMHRRETTPLWRSWTIAGPFSPRRPRRKDIDSRREALTLSCAGN